MSSSTPENRDIRAWATSHGLELAGNGRGRIPDSIKQQYRQAMGIPEPDPAPAPPTGEGEPPPTEQDTSASTSTGTPRRGPTPSRPKEVPPKRSGIFDRWKSKREGRKAARGRQSTERLLSSAWGGAAKLLAGFGALPLARVMEMQAPVAGALLEPEIRGSIVDSPLQPFARLMNRGSVIGALVGLPLMVQAVSMRPELYQTLHPYMVDAIWRWFEIAEPEFKKKLAQLEARKERFDIDPDALLAQIFAPPTQEPPTVVDADAA